MIRIVNTRNTKEGEYIGRGSPLGNPFKIVANGYTRAQVISMYEEWLKNQILNGNKAIISEINRLLNIAANGDLILRCYCAPLPCHGDVIKKFLEELL